MSATLLTCVSMTGMALAAVPPSLGSPGTPQLGATRSVDPHWSSRGVVLGSRADGDSLLALSLHGWGRGDDIVRASAPRVIDSGGQRRYERDGLVEWYETGGGAIEHGFTLLRRPSSVCADGDVRLHLSFDSELDVEVLPSAIDAVFRSPGTSSAVFYEGLIAWDVAGRAVGARFEPHDRGIAIVLDDRDAEYPITVDPWIVVQEAKLSDPAPTVPFGDFGRALSIQADTIAVGAELESSEAGKVYLFQRTAGAWTPDGVLVASDSVSDERFGSDLDIDGDWLVAGAPLGNNVQGADAGSAYVFRRNGAVWTEHTKLVPPDLVADDRFGGAVAIDGETLVVSAVLQGASVGSSGSVYVFVYDGSAWVQQAKLTAETTRLGGRLDLDGDVLVAGARTHSFGFEFVSAGAAFIFRRSGTSWGPGVRVNSPTPELRAEFGHSVAVSGNRVAVGCLREASQRGAVYVFEAEGNDWPLRAKLWSFQAGTSDNFGSAVDLAGDLLAVGSENQDTGGQSSGEAYLFQRSASGWAQQARFIAADSIAGTRLGNSIAISGDTVVAGGSHLDAAYVFRFNTTSAFCFGDGSLATQCPCAPPDLVPVPSGGSRSGCANAFNPAGARLEVGGTANPETWGFVADMGPSYGGFAMLVKGDGRNLSGIANGDGVRCVDGNLVRFGGHFAGEQGHPAGLWGYPNLLMTTAVSAATLQAPAQTAYYQLLYRHAAPGFCSPETLNWSNAVHIDW